MHGCGGAGQEGHQPPNGGGRGEQAQRDFGDDSEGAFRADEEVQQIHVGLDEVTGGVFDGGAGEGGQGAGDRAEREICAAGLVAPAAQLQAFAVGEHYAEGGDVVAGGAVEEGIRAGCVAGDHAADGGGCFRGVGREGAA